MTGNRDGRPWAVEPRRRADASGEYVQRPLAPVDGAGWQVEAEHLDRRGGRAWPVRAAPGRPVPRSQTRTVASPKPPPVTVTGLAAVLICSEVSAALAAAHARGIVHRDVTPANVMLTASGAKVVDFGISALIGENDIDPDGSLLDTPCGVPLLSQACDLASVGHYASDGVLELSVFKVRGAITERVQATRATRSDSATKGQLRGPDEFSAPTGSTATCTCRSSAPRCSATSAKLSHAYATIRPATRPDGHRAATEVPRNSGHAPCASAPSAS
jgi:protein kinase-like protein